MPFDDDELLDVLHGHRDALLELKGQVEALQRLVLLRLEAEADPDLVKLLITMFPAKPVEGSVQPISKPADVVLTAPDEMRRKLVDLLARIE